MSVTEIGGFLGVGLSGVAYAPQIVHLMRCRCSAGVSRPAYIVWLVASILLAVKAIAIQAWVFIALGAIEVVAITLILFYAARFDDIEGRRAGRGLEAEAGDIGGNRRLRQPPACAHADGARPGRRAAADGLPGGARGRPASLRRDRRQQANAPPRDSDRRRGPRLPHLQDRTISAQQELDGANLPKRFRRRPAWRASGSSSEVSLGDP